MKTIKVYDDTQSSVIFNKIIYRKKLDDFEEYYNHIQLDKLANEITQDYNRKNSFNENIGEKLLHMNVAQSRYVIVDAKDSYNNLNKLDNNKIVTPDNIIIGRDRNYPRYKSILIESYHNIKSEFTNDNSNNILFDDKVISDIKLLSGKLYNYIHIKDQINNYTKDKHQNDVINKKDFGNSERKEISKFIIKAKFPSDMINDINKYLSYSFGIELDPNDIMQTSRYLTSIGLADAIYAMFSSDHKAFKQILTRYENQVITSRLDMQQFISSYLEITSVNIIKRIIRINFPKHINIIDVMNKNNITNFNDFKQIVKPALYDKIMKILKFYKPSGIKPCNAHDQLVSIFRDMLFNQPRKYDLTTANDIIDQIKTISTNENGLYFCKTCKREIACEHQFVVVINNYSPKKQDMYSVIKEFVGENDSKVYYCRICKQKLYYDMLYDFMSSSDFELMQKNRETSIENNNESVLFDKYLVSSIYSALSLFKFKLDFSMNNLLKSIKNLISPFVYGLIRINKIGDDLFEPTAKLYSYVYTIIYMMDNYSHDKNIELDGLRERDRNAYGKYMIPKILSRYRSFTNKLEVQNLLKIAYKDLYSEYKFDIQYITNTMKLISMSNTVIYQLAYMFYRNETKDLSSSHIEAFPKIISGKNPTEVDLATRISPPTKSDHDMHIYNLIINHGDSRNYAYKLQHDIPGVDISKEFNPESYDYFVKLDEETKKQTKIKQFIQRRELKMGTREIKTFPLYLIYDISGDIIRLIPEKIKSKIEFTWNGTPYKSLKDPGNNKLITARNKKLNYEITSKKTIKYKPGNLSNKSSDLNVNKEKYQYKFDDKLLILIPKITSKYHVNQFKFLGQSEDKTKKEILSITETEPFRNDDYRISRVFKYVSNAIILVQTLLSNPSHQLTIEAIESTKIKYDKISKLKSPSSYFKKGFYNDYQEIQHWDPIDKYNWLVESYLVIINGLYKDYPAPLNKFIIDKIIEDTMTSEKMTYKIDVSVSVSIEDMDDTGIQNDEDIGEFEGDDDIYEEDEDNIVISD